MKKLFKFTKCHFILSLMWLSVMLHGADLNDRAKKLADKLNIEKKDVPKDPEIKKIVPNYPDMDSHGTPRVPETSYYNSGLQIEDQARIKAQYDDTAIQIEQSRNLRPNFKLDPSRDPEFKRYDEISQKAHRLSETYNGCVDIPVGTKDVTRYREETCNVNGHKETVEFKCQRTLEVTCTNSNAGKLKDYSSGDFEVSGDRLSVRKVGESTYVFESGRRTGSCRFYRTEVRFYVGWSDYISEIYFSSINYDDWLDISLNGNLVFRGIGPHQGKHLTGQYDCEYHRIWQGRPFRPDKPTFGWNTLSFVNQVDGAGEISVTLNLVRKYDCNKKKNYSVRCENGHHHIDAALKKKNCNSRGRERLIRGIPVYNSCWGWEELYTKLTPPIFTREKKCDELVSSGCAQTGAECITPGSGFCALERLKFSCPYLDSARHTRICGNEFVCSDGDCAKEFQERNRVDNTEEFKRAATGLGVAHEIAKELDAENLLVFKGYSRKCGEDNVYGSSNCCKASGWGQDIGLAKCKSSEKELGMAREAGRTIYVGSYKTGGAANRRKYKTFCIYPSKLARIFISQGKAQLGKGFGGPRSPDCTGFTVEELGLLDMNSMDLSEFYGDVMKKASNGSKPSGSDALNDVKEKIKNRIPNS